MTDIVSPAVRSRMMSGIKGKNTLPEMRLRRYLHGLGFRYRLHVRSLSGEPDLVLPRYRTVIFVHGCYWHRHSGCQYTSTPASNVNFWQQKFGKNVARDAKVVNELLEADWKVIVIWECGLRRPDFEASLAWLSETIRTVRTAFFEWPPDKR